MIKFLYLRKLKIHKCKNKLAKNSIDKKLFFSKPIKSSKTSLLLRED